MAKYSDQPTSPARANKNVQQERTHNVSERTPTEHENDTRFHANTISSTVCSTLQEFAKKYRVSEHVVADYEVDRFVWRLTETAVRSMRPGWPRPTTFEAVVNAVCNPESKTPLLLEVFPAESLYHIKPEDDLSLALKLRARTEWPIRLNLKNWLSVEEANDLLSRVGATNSNIEFYYRIPGTYISELRIGYPLPPLPTKRWWQFWK